MLGLILVQSAFAVDGMNYIEGPYEVQAELVVQNGKCIALPSKTSQTWAFTQESDKSFRVKATSSQLPSMTFTIQTPDPDTFLFTGYTEFKKASKKTDLQEVSFTLRVAETVYKYKKELYYDFIADAVLVFNNGCVASYRFSALTP